MSPRALLLPLALVTALVAQAVAVRAKVPNEFVPGALALVMVVSVARALYRRWALKSERRKASAGTQEMLSGAPLHSALPPLESLLRGNPSSSVQVLLDLDGAEVVDALRPRTAHPQMCAELPGVTLYHQGDTWFALIAGKTLTPFKDLLRALRTSASPLSGIVAGVPHEANAAQLETLLGRLFLAMEAVGVCAPVQTAVSLATQGELAAIAARDTARREPPTLLDVSREALMDAIRETPGLVARRPDHVERTCTLLHLAERTAGLRARMEVVFRHLRAKHAWLGDDPSYLLGTVVAPEARVAAAELTASIFDPWVNRTLPERCARWSPEGTQWSWRRHGAALAVLAVTLGVALDGAFAALESQNVNGLIARAASFSGPNIEAQARRYVLLGEAATRAARLHAFPRPVGALASWGLRRRLRMAFGEPFEHDVVAPLARTLHDRFTRCRVEQTPTLTCANAAMFVWSASLLRVDDEAARAVARREVIRSLAVEWRLRLFEEGRRSPPPMQRSRALRIWLEDYAADGRALAFAPVTDSDLLRELPLSLVLTQTIQDIEGNVSTVHGGKVAQVLVEHGVFDGVVEPPAAFTAGAWRAVVAASIRRESARLAAQPWIRMAVPPDRDPAAYLEERLVEEYFQDYEDAWRRFLERVHLSPTSTESETLSMINRISGQVSPYETLLCTVAEHTQPTWRPAPGLLEQISDSLWAPARMAAEVPPRHAEHLRDAFKPAIELAFSAEGPPCTRSTMRPVANSPLRVHLSTIRTIREEWNYSLESASVADIRGRLERARAAWGVSAGDGSALDAVRKMLIEPIDRIDAVLTSRRIGVVQERYCRQVFAPIARDRDFWRRGGVPDVALDTLREVYGPAGALERLFEGDLGGLNGVNRAPGMLWPEFLIFVNRAAPLREAFTGWSFGLTFRDPPPGIGRVELTFGQAQATCEHGADGTVVCGHVHSRWPPASDSNVVSLHVYAPDESVCQTFDVDGELAPWRLLDQGARRWNAERSHVLATFFTRCGNVSLVVAPSPSARRLFGEDDLVTLFAPLYDARPPPHMGLGRPECTDAS